MTRLQMYIGKMLIDQEEIEYTDMLTCSERQEHQENIAAEMYLRHLGKIKQAMKEPEFFIIGQQSSFNELTLREIENLPDYAQTQEEISKAACNEARYRSKI